MKTNRIAIWAFACIVLLGVLPAVLVDAVQKIQLNTTDAQNVSNKTFDNTNTYNGGTFTNPTLSGMTFASPVWSSGTFTLTPITANSLLYANGSKQLTGLQLDDGELLIGSTGNLPVAATLTGTANQITITPSAGGITISTPQNIHTAAIPTFSGLTLTGVTAGKILTTNMGGTVQAISTAVGVTEGGTGLTAAPANGQLPIGNGTNYTLATLTAGSGIGVSNTAGAITITAFPRSYIAGYTLSTPGSSATMNIAAGQATDSTNTAVINASSSISKTTASWSVGTGNGCLDTGAVGTNTWYHFYAILRPDTGVSDILCSTSASSPTMPSNYTKARRIGSGKTNGSSQWITFTQLEDEFLWNDAVLDVDDTDPTTSAISSTMSVPTGLKVRAIVNQVLITGGGGASACILSSPDQTDTAPSTSALPLANIYAAASSVAANRLEVRTNASAQIRRRCSFSDGSTIHRIAALGWIDPRGKES
jgi:hypothetical protein